MKARRGKRIFTILVTVILVIAAIPAAGFAQGDTIEPTPTIEDASEPVSTTTEQAPTPSLTPAVTNTEPTKNTVTDASDFTVWNGIITGYFGSGGDVVIPSTINGETISRIDYDVFKDNRTITSISIPDTVESIGAGAFMNCSKLETIRLSNKLTVLENSLFSGCNSLKNIDFPNSLKTIDNYAFRGCSALTSVTFPENLSEIGEGAFSDCASLGSIITFPSSISKIDSWAFNNSPKIKEFIFMGDAPELGQYGVGSGSPGQIGYYQAGAIGFDGYTWSSELPCYPIEKRPFFQELEQNFEFRIDTNTPESFGEITLTKYIGSSPDVVIPDGVNHVDVLFSSEWGWMNEKNTKIATITIPASVETFATQTLSSCINLKSIKVSPDNPYFYYDEQSKTLYNRDKTEILYYSADNTAREFTVPTHVKCIGMGAFGNNPYLETITIHDSFSELSYRAFYNCSSLKQVDLGNSVKIIDAGAFSNCTQLTTVECSLESFLHFETDRIFFGGCNSLQKIILKGDAPEKINGITITHDLLEYIFNINAYLDDPYRAPQNLTFYYYPSANGFTTPTWHGFPCYPLEEEKPEPEPTPSPTPDKPTTEPEEVELKIHSLSEEQRVIAEDKILAVLKIDKLAEGSSIQYYDIKLINTETGEAYTEDNFPKEGVDVLLPYPEGTNQTSHTFRLFQFAEGIEGNPVEVKPITLTEEGIKFHADSLSPFALVSTAVEGTKNPVETSETMPKTGDSGLPIWIPILMLVAASVSIILLLYRRKAYKA